ncbi:MAG: hypothetical protein PHN56_07015 [Candidatus Nanoarchaeia archaeon]|nr:hypothetical protein [Candidatus Nanoarchaeia archaeon]
MSNLLKICQLYDAGFGNNNQSIDYNFTHLFLYRSEKSKAQQNNQNFNESEFNESYCKALNIEPKFLEELGSNCSNLFQQYSNALGIYEISNIKESLNNYKTAQKKFKKLINYVGFTKNNNKIIYDLSLESLLSNDDNKFTKTKSAINEYKTVSQNFLKDAIKKYSNTYDNLTFNDFKQKGVSDELAMQKYAQHISSVFSASKQAEKENKKDVLGLKKDFKSIKKLMNAYEQKKIKLNLNISKRLYAAGNSVAQVDDILGKGYANKKRWNENLTPIFEDILQSIFTEKPKKK